ncbi:MAG: SCP2 sterol-binding domain-containing protein [Pseudomonadota bacterium]
MILPLYAMIEFSLNQAIKLDPQGGKLIKNFHGKIIKLEILSPDMNIYILAQGGNFQILENFEGDVDTTIKTRLIDLAALSLKNKTEKTQAVFEGQIKILGNIALGQQFQSLFTKLDIDWEEHLSHITGDIIAHQLFTSGKKLFTWGQKTQQTFSLDISEFLQYETRDLLEKREVDNFLTQIDELRNDCDRLEARINRLTE